MPHFKAKDNPEGVPQTPKVTVDGKERIICLKGSSKDKVCTNKRCNFAHIFSLDTIDKGTGDLNTWTLATDGVKWSPQEVKAAAAKAKIPVKKEDTGKDDK